MTTSERGDLEALADLVRERRKALGLTQAELARRVGWSQGRISVIERGKYGLPSVLMLNRLADALEVSLPTVLEALGFPLRARREVEVGQPGGTSAFPTTTTTAFTVKLCCWNADASHRTEAALAARAEKRRELLQLPWGPE